MNGGHHFPFAVEGQFVRSRGLSFEFRLFHSEFAREVYECDFRRVSVHSLVNGGVGAEAHSLGEKPEIGFGNRSEVLSFNYSSALISLDYRHFVLG